MILKCSFTIWVTNCKRVNLHLNKEYNNGTSVLKMDGKNKKEIVNLLENDPEIPTRRFKQKKVAKYIKVCEKLAG